MEFGEYLPTDLLSFILNKSSPFMSMPTQIACIKIPFYLRNHWTGDTMGYLRR